MARYVMINAVRGLLTLFAVSILVFSLARLTGDPIDVLAPVDISREDEAALRERWGLNGSIWEQYVSFVGNASQGDFGPGSERPAPA